MSGLKALAHHGELLLDAPAATPLLAEHFDMSVFAGSHKHDRLLIPYRKGETVSGVSGGSFTLVTSDGLLLTKRHPASGCTTSLYSWAICAKSLSGATPS